MIDQRELVFGKDILRIVGRIMRFAAQAMSPQIGHDYAKASFSEQFGVAIFNPVGFSLAEIAVQQKERAALPQFPIGNADPIGRFKIFGDHIRLKLPECRLV